MTTFWIVLAGLVVISVLPFLRQWIFSWPIFVILKKLNVLPKISETERVALDAGTVWVEGELFSGRPNFRRIFSENYPSLSAEEQTFLDGPVERVCAMVSDWQVYQARDLSASVWEALKNGGFFGMIIPKKYGGLEFSAIAHSAVISKLASRCSPLAITVMVPNSLGPAELLIHYGTEAQKNHYLPRLAKGLEIPCFGLTEPEAGSDAGSITADGEVFTDASGKICVRLNWKKRYITLGAVSTIIGLAFKLRDPGNILGKGKDLGITCALIPANTPGVVLGRRHDPLGVPFFNSPIEGQDVVVRVEDAVIGGANGVGQGWRMLMECLAAGRGISLPATAAGGGKLTARVVSAYASIRKQFGLSIGKFEGVQMPLARIAGYAYILEAARIYTCGGIDRGAKPAVVTAIAKYHSTEMLRKSVNDGMDILGGAGISRGPKNLLAHAYTGLPVGITVEGANILTRSLIIFGQGLIRCHPYILKEVGALESGDIRAFDRAFWGHQVHVGRNFLRMIFLGISRGWLSFSFGRGRLNRYQRKLARTSATFAFWVDVALLLFGGKLKRKEEISGRFADILSWMYLASATMRRFDAEGRKADDLPAAQWALEHAFGEIQSAFLALSRNMGWVYRILGLGIWLNPIGSGPKDRLSFRLARRVQQPGAFRDGLTRGIYLPGESKEPLRALDEALEAVSHAQESIDVLKKAQKSGKLRGHSTKKRVEEAVANGLLSVEEGRLVLDSEEKRVAAIQVDDFSLEDYLKQR
jgi:acyl-CoA dehydrogenase